LHALFGIAVRECLRPYPAACLALQIIVADRGRCAEGLFNIARLENMKLSIRVMCPDSGETICLQFHADLQGILLILSRTL